MEPMGEPEDPDPLDLVPLRFIVGPTASGKSRLGIAVARELGAEILSLDSMAIYRGMDVGTAKPTEEERGAVPHHLIDLADPGESFDLQRYLEAARDAVRGIVGRGRVPLFVGGTGLYLSALLRGLFRGPASDPARRAALEQRADDEGLPALHAELERVDPASAQRIHPNDRRRIVRALEVFEDTGTPLSEHTARPGAQWGGEPSPRERRARIVGLRYAVDAIDVRIARRTAEMLREGWPEEALALEEAGGLGRSAGQALGYGTALRLARGEVTFDEAAAEIALRTRQFARRQRTWLRRFDVCWLEGDVERGAADLVEPALEHLRAE